ncbi:MAG: leucine-rich repeat domain-containing protein, partial [Longicatena sp.]
MLIKDEALREAIARTLQMKPEDITIADMEKLTMLSARSMGIISLKGLQHAVNLNYLDLCGNAIEDLDPIKDLREIEYLNLSKNMLRDIQALREFRQLQRLDISRNNLYTMDVSALAAMINLKE